MNFLIYIMIVRYKMKFSFEYHLFFTEKLPIFPKLLIDKNINELNSLKMI